MEYFLIDSINMDQNILRCTCGTYIYPDCDISAVSIAAAFNHHLRTAHQQGENRP